MSFVCFGYEQDKKGKGVSGLKVETWKKHLQRIGFEGSVSAWPDVYGNDFSVEAVPESRLLKPVQVVFKVGANDNRTAAELLRDFSLALASVLSRCRDQVLEYQSP